MLSVPTGPVTEAKMVPWGTSVVTADQSKLVLITHALWLLHTEKPLILACIAILYDKIITIQLEQAMVWYRIKCLRKVKEMASAGVPIFSDSVHLRKMAKKEVCCAGSLCGEAVLALWSDTVALHMFQLFYFIYIYINHTLRWVNFVATEKIEQVQNCRISLHPSTPFYTFRTRNNVDFCSSVAIAALDSLQPTS